MDEISKYLRTLALLLLHLLDVELQLLALKDVAVAAAALTRAGGDAGIQAATRHLFIDQVGDLVVDVALLQLPLHVVGLLGLLGLGLGLGLLLGGLLDANLSPIVLLVPGLEWAGIHLDNGILHEGLGADLQGQRRNR